ncbi:MAG: shikimate dehydrogenase [Desulfobacula sp.]|nr:shikimate dehydrogenase [Desulfobacula sp.]
MIDSNTSLYAIFGNPVHHSKSPLIHNASFKKTGLNAVYLAFEISDISKGLNTMRNLNIKGASITLPFKVDVMEELDTIDDKALQIGAVNTVINKNGILHGYNTDCAAAITPLKPMGIQNKTVCIIGAGGAAQAVAHGIFKEKGNIIILNRSQKSGQALADKINGQFISMTPKKNQKIKKEKEIGEHRIDILINTTSVGMFPKAKAQPFPSKYLHSDMVVMDIVYNPIKTQLLMEAQKKGCKTIDGLSMFIYQGAAQFELWTGITPDLALMRTAAISGDK